MTILIDLIYKFKLTLFFNYIENIEEIQVLTELQIFRSGKVPTIGFRK